MRVTKCLIVLTVAIAATSWSRVDAGIVGPGDNGSLDGGTNDSSANLLLVAATATESLAAGNYNVTGWEYTFDTVGAANIAGSTITPFLATGDASTDTYTYVAVGDTITVASNVDASTFGSPVTFGVNNTFSLGAAANVYAGFLMTLGTGTRAPIAFESGSGDEGLIHYAAGVVAPVVGNSPSGGTSNGTAFSRHYDFQITTAPAVVPEPSSLLLLCGAAGVLGLLIRRRRTA